MSQNSSQPQPRIALLLAVDAFHHLKQRVEEIERDGPTRERCRFVAEAAMALADASDGLRLNPEPATAAPADVDDVIEKGGEKSSPPQI